MAFFPPIPLIRKNLIIKKLTECNAFSEKTAKTFIEAGIINPDGFKKVNEKLIKEKILVRTKDGKYYLNKQFIGKLKYYNCYMTLKIYYIIHQV